MHSAAMWWPYIVRLQKDPFLLKFITNDKSTCLGLCVHKGNTWLCENKRQSSLVGTLCRVKVTLT